MEKLKCFGFDFALKFALYTQKKKKSQYSLLPTTPSHDGAKKELEVKNLWRSNTPLRPMSNHEPKCSRLFYASFGGYEMLRADPPILRQFWRL